MGSVCVCVFCVVCVNGVLRAKFPFPEGAHEKWSLIHVVNFMCEHGIFALIKWDRTNPNSKRKFFCCGQNVKRWVFIYWEFVVFKIALIAHFLCHFFSFSLVSLSLSLCPTNIPNIVRYWLVRVNQHSRKISKQFNYNFNKLLIWIWIIHISLVNVCCRKGKSILKCKRSYVERIGNNSFMYCSVLEAYVLYADDGTGCCCTAP